MRDPKAVWEAAPIVLGWLSTLGKSQNSREGRADGPHRDKLVILLP